MDVPADLCGWLTGRLVPGWRRLALVPGRAGFVEAFGPGARPLDHDQGCGTLATARLTYVFAHAHVLTRDPADLAAAEHGLATLETVLRDPADGGFRHRVGRDGAVLDGRKDAYDHAFVLFALAWLYQAAPTQALLDLAERTWAFLAGRLADPVHGGFREHVDGLGEPMPLPRRQNPHMHLLEALQALFAATGDRRWLDRAQPILDLFERRLFDPESGSIAEFFTADWRRAEGAAGRLREPGHQFEWTWLLLHHARLTGDARPVAWADRLYRFGTDLGLDREGLPAALDEVDPEGRVLAGTKLLWPQTEWLKACLARRELAGDAGAPAEAAVATIFRAYVAADGVIWANQLDRAGRPLAVPLLSRVLYHVMLAMAEAVRLGVAAGGHHG